MDPEIIMKICLSVCFCLLHPIGAFSALFLILHGVHTPHIIEWNVWYITLYASDFQYDRPYRDGPQRQNSTLNALVWGLLMLAQLYTASWCTALWGYPLMVAVTPHGHDLYACTHAHRYWVMWWVHKKFTLSVPNIIYTFPINAYHTFLPY